MTQESDRALLQEALEALKRMESYGNLFLYKSHERNPYEQVCDAITNITARLSQPAAQPCHMPHECNYAQHCLYGCNKQTAAQPTTRKATRDEKIVNPGVYEVAAERPAAHPVPHKLHNPPGGADPLDVVYVEGWNACCDAFFGGKPPIDPVVITVEKTSSAQPVAIPAEPTEEMWGGLARDIIMWMDMYSGRDTTPRNLFKHLERLGRDIPQWLRDEPEMKSLDHVPSKGTRAVIVYKAILNAAPAATAQPVAWRELCRRLYVELFHCNRQMTQTYDVDGDPLWQQSKIVRDVLADAKAALESHAAPAVTPAADIARDAARLKDLQDLVSKALHLAWQLGQTYWQQADSEYISQQKKSDSTQERFNALVEETREALAKEQP